MRAPPIGSAGLDAASQRFARSAERTTRAFTPAGKGVDLAAEAVEQIGARTTFSTNLAVIRTADEMTGRLLDILA